MTEIYNEAKEIARALLELETERKSILDKQKVLKAELLAIVEENSITDVFEFSNGLVFCEQKTKYEIPDGLNEIVIAQSTEPNQISQDFIEQYFNSKLSLNKVAKKAIKDGDSNLLSVIIPKTELKVTIVVA